MCCWASSDPEVNCEILGLGIQVRASCNVLNAIVSIVEYRQFKFLGLNTLGVYKLMTRSWVQCSPDVATRRDSMNTEVINKKWFSINKKWKPTKVISFRGLQVGMTHCSYSLILLREGHPWLTRTYRRTIVLLYIGLNIFFSFL